MLGYQGGSGDRRDGICSLARCGIEEFLRILKYPLNEHFKMQMGSRRTTGATYLSNLLPTLDQITQGSLQLFERQIPRPDQRTAAAIGLGNL